MPAKTVQGSEKWRKQEINADSWTSGCLEFHWIPLEWRRTEQDTKTQKHCIIYHCSIILLGYPLPLGTCLLVGDPPTHTHMRESTSWFSSYSWRQTKQAITCTIIGSFSKWDDSFWKICSFHAQVAEHYFLKLITNNPTTTDNINDCSSANIAKYIIIHKLYKKGIIAITLLR